jgi:hypothetical protein
MLTESGFSPKVSAASLAWGFPIMKKVACVLVAVGLAPVLVVSLVLVASAEWRQAGETGMGDKVSVSSIKILKNNQRTALVRVEYKEPATLPQGGPFVEMRARVRFNCETGNAAPPTVWFYSRDRSGRLVVSKKEVRDDLFGKDSEGGFGEMASKYVCQNR